MADAESDGSSKALAVVGLLVGLAVFGLGWLQRRESERLVEAGGADLDAAEASPTGETAATEVPSWKAELAAMLAEERAERFRWVRRVWAHFDDEDAAIAFGMLNTFVEHVNDGETDYAREYELRWGSLTGRLTGDVAGVPWRDAVRQLSQQLGYEIDADERAFTWNLIDPEGALEDDHAVEVESLVLDAETGDVLVTSRDHRWQRQRVVFPAGPAGDDLRASLRQPLPVGPIRTVITRPRRDGRRQLVAWLEPGTRAGDQPGLARVVAADISLSNLERALYPFEELRVGLHDAIPDVRVNVDAADADGTDVLIAVADSAPDDLLVFKDEDYTAILPYDQDRIPWSLNLDAAATDLEQLALVPEEGYPTQVAWPASFDQTTRAALLVALAERSYEVWATWTRDQAGERSLRSLVILVVEPGP